MTLRDDVPPNPINRGDLLLLGISSGVTGGMVGGILLGWGIGMIVQGANIGYLLLTVGAPLSGVVGWIMARRLAKRTGLR
jgi:predicted lipid-binding transport protein (Tim44 family)